MLVELKSLSPKPGAAFGAWLVTQVSAGGLRKALPFILAAVLVYTLSRKDLGREHAPHRGVVAERASSQVRKAAGLWV